MPPPHTPPGSPPFPPPPPESSTAATVPRGLGQPPRAWHHLEPRQPPRLPWPPRIKAGCRRLARKGAGGGHGCPQPQVLGPGGGGGVTAGRQMCSPDMWPWFLQETAPPATTVSQDGGQAAWPWRGACPAGPPGWGAPPKSRPQGGNGPAQVQPAEGQRGVQGQGWSQTGSLARDTAGQEPPSPLAPTTPCRGRDEGGTPHAIPDGHRGGRPWDTQQGLQGSGLPEVALDEATRSPCPRAAPVRLITARPWQALAQPRPGLPSGCKMGVTEPAVPPGTC